MTKEKVSSTKPSDTEVQLFVRGATATRVLFKSASISSSLVTVYCSCSSFAKGQFCRHIWAGLLKAQKSYPDFFEGKTEIEKAEVIKTQAVKSGYKTSESQIQIQQILKKKQSEYQKLQYLKLKQYKKNEKNKLKKPEKNLQDLPIAVRQAIHYFSENGFTLGHPIDRTELGLAKKKLARVFHPDIGGSHKEILELNKFYEILSAFSKP